MVEEKVFKRKSIVLLDFASQFLFTNNKHHGACKQIWGCKIEQSINLHYESFIFEDTLSNYSIPMHLKIEFTFPKSSSFFLFLRSPLTSLIDGVHLIWYLG